MPFEFQKVVESLEEVPEEYRGVYGEGSGDNADKYVLNPVVAPLADAIGSLNKTLAGTRADKKKATDEAAGKRVALKSFEELAQEQGITYDPEDLLGGFKNHLIELTDKVKNGKELGINMEKIKADADRQVEERVGVANAKTEKMFASLTKAKIGDVAVRALTEAGAASVDLLLPHMMGKAKVVEDGEDYSVRVLDADGEARSDGKGGWFSLTDLALEMKADAKYAPAFKSEAKGGTGTGADDTKRTITDTSKQGEKSSVDKISAGLGELQKQ
jgi:hypothetical protein